MTPTTHAYNESSKLTKTSSLERPVGGVDTHAASSAQTCLVIELDVGKQIEETLPRGYQTVGDLAKEYEKNPKRRKAMAKARSWLAGYSNEGRTLRTFRLKKGLSQAALAERAGMTQAHIAKLEAGQSDAQMSTVLRLAKALALKPSTLFEALVLDKVERAQPTGR